MSETPDYQPDAAGSASSVQPMPSPFEKPTAPSIVDTILDLDEFLSGDVRRAEKTAYFATRPDLEAKIDELEHQLEEVADDNGRPIDAGDVSLSDGQHPAVKLADQIAALQAEYKRSFKGVRVRQLDGDAWVAFRTKHKAILEDPDSPKRSAMWNDLIVVCAVAPLFTLEKIQKLRKAVGNPQVAEIEMACWAVNTSSGVSVPKSPLSSRVLRQRTPGMN